MAGGCREGCQQTQSIFRVHEARESDSFYPQHYQKLELEHNWHPELDSDLIAHKAWQVYEETGINPCRFLLNSKSNVLVLSICQEKGKRESVRVSGS
jgi:hypothetical protein